MVNCRGCHSPLHVSYNEPGVGSWLFTNWINNPNVPAYKPNLPLNYMESIYYYDNSNSTSGLGADISNWAGEIHWAWTSLSGQSISPSTRYLICLNCHFITTNPAEAGIIKMIDGRRLIAVPEFTLNLSPHAISDSELENMATNNEKTIFYKENIGIISGSIAAIGIIGLIHFRRRKHVSTSNLR
jgi:hypothetical protein